MTLSRLPALVLVTILCFTTSVGASDNSCENPLLIASTKVPPLVYQSSKGLQGTVQKPLQTMLRERNLSYAIEFYPWARALKLANEGKVDALMPAMHSKQRAEFLDFSLEPIGKVDLAVFTHKDYLEYLPDSLSSTSRVATMRSLNYSEQQLNGASVVETSDFESALLLLNAKRVEFLLGVKAIVEQGLRDKNITDIVNHHVVGTRPVYLALAKNSDNYRNLQTCF